MCVCVFCVDQKAVVARENEVRNPSTKYCRVARAFYLFFFFLTKQRQSGIVANEQTVPEPENTIYLRMYIYARVVYIVYYTYTQIYNIDMHTRNINTLRTYDCCRARTHIKQYTLSSAASDASLCWTN